MKNEKLKLFIKKLDEGLYKNCVVRVKLDKKGYAVSVKIEKEITEKEED